MNRTEQFYQKYPQLKEEKPKKVRKGKKAAKEDDGFTGIKKNREGVIISNMTEERLSSITPAEKIEHYLKENNLPIVEDWVPCTSGFIALVEENGFKSGYESAKVELQNNKTEENEEMNYELVKAAVKEVMEGARTKELGLEIRLQEARNRELELKLELSRTTSTEGKITEIQSVEDKLIALFGDEAAAWLRKGKIQEIEEPVKPTRRGRRTEVEVEVVKSNGVVVKQDAPIRYSTPLRNAKGRLTVDWKTSISKGIFESVLLDIVIYAQENGVDIANVSQFKSFNSLANGAYQQYVIANKGIKGAWKTFIESHKG